MLKVLENLKLLGKLVFEIKVNCLKVAINEIYALDSVL